MPSTPILGITQVSIAQNQKEVTINDAILALEAATNAVLSVSMASGNVYTLSATQATRNMIFKTTAATAACELRFPTEVNGLALNRCFVVRNESGFALTVKFGTGTGGAVVIPNNQSRLIFASNGADMFVGAEASTTLSFMALSDSPGSYAGMAGKLLAANTAENALVFIDAPVFPSYADKAGQFLVVNATENGIEWITPSYAVAFTELNDAPNSFAGSGGKLVAVNGDGDALEFIDPPAAEVVTYASSTRWRVRTIVGGTETKVGWGEIAFRDVDGINLIGTGVASSSSYDTGREPAYAFDGSTAEGLGWYSEEGNVADSWVEYTFDDPEVVRSVRLWPINGFPGYSPTQFIIEAYVDGGWIALGQRTAEWDVAGAPTTFTVNGLSVPSLTSYPYQINLSDMVTDLTTGDGKAAWVVPYDCTLVEVFTALAGAVSSVGAVTVAARLGGVDLFTTNPSIDATETTNLTGTLAALGTTALTKGDIILFDIDAAGTGAKGLIVTVKVLPA